MIEVINSLLSYLLLVLVIVTFGGVAIFLGIFFNKIKDKRNQVLVVEETDSEE